MVEESIRRILPSVMNEVLIKAVASTMVISEPAKLRQVVSKPQQRSIKSQQTGNSGKSLREILHAEDAGADFYDSLKQDDFSDDVVVENNTKSMAQRIQSLSPELQSLAEGIVIDDGGEMWDDDISTQEFSSVRSDLATVRDPVADASKIGLNFSRIRDVAMAGIKKNSTNNLNDSAAAASFDELRLKRMRESLEVKPRGR